jgi:hypothetical protein
MRGFGEDQATQQTPTRETCSDVAHIIGITVADLDQILDCPAYKMLAFRLLLLRCR